MVPTEKRSINLATEQVTILCVKFNAETQFKGKELLLVHWEQPTLTEDITIEEGLITVLDDRSSYVSIPIANTSKQDVALNQCTVLGQLQTSKTTYRTKQVHIDEREKLQGMVFRGK